VGLPLKFIVLYFIINCQVCKTDDLRLSPWYGRI